MCYKPVGKLRFLGLCVSQTGTIGPWREDFTTQLYQVKGRVVNAGLGNLPLALSRALQIKVLPAMVYGGEIWGVSWVTSVVKGKCSPYKCKRMDQVVNFLRDYCGLPRNSFQAVLFRLLNFPTMLHLLLPRLQKFMCNLSSE